MIKRFPRPSVGKYLSCENEKTKQAIIPNMANPHSSYRTAEGPNSHPELDTVPRLLPAPTLDASHPRTSEFPPFSGFHKYYQFPPTAAESERLPSTRGEDNVSGHQNGHYLLHTAPSTSYSSLRPLNPLFSARRPTRNRVSIFLSLL